MKTIFRHSFSIMLGLSLYSGVLKSQSCGSDIIHSRMMNQSDYKNIYESEQREIYLKTIQNNGIRSSGSNNYCGGVKTIPIVVHVMHLGEMIGSGSNISDAQIQQAIAGLNNYWRNQSATGVVDMEIQFELAKRDTNGNVTNGIVRVNASSVPGYSTVGVTLDPASCPGPIDTDIKQLSFWPVGEYYNVWVISDICQNFGGFANLPFGGWSDGTMIKAEYMTYESIILTHELGHGFNLVHTFNGDNGGANCPEDNDCLIDGDQVCDTPPHTINDCDNVNDCSASGNWDYSRTNFMSYCFYDPMLFTPGQKTRAQLASEGSVRSPLLFSSALVPVGLQREVGIESIETPEFIVCSSLFDAKILVKNYGTTAVQNLTCEVYIDDISMGVFNTNVSIQPGATGLAILQNCPITLGNHQLKITILSVNNQQENSYLANNSLCKEITYSLLENLPFCENYELNELPSYLTVVNPDGVSSWELTNTTGCNETNGVKTMVYNASSYSSVEPTYDEVQFLPINLSNVSSATFDFRIAQIRSVFCNTYLGLQVEASTDCGETFSTELYNKNDAYTILSDCGGPNQCPCTQATPEPLCTVDNLFEPSFDNPWQPSTCNEWRNESVSLNALVGNESVILKFKASKATFIANNIYIDNVCLNVSYNPLNIPSNENKQTLFSIYPNPSSDYYNLNGFVQNDEAINYRLVSSSGQLVKSGKIETKDGRVQSELYLSDLPAGVYVLHLSSKSIFQTLKIIHQ
jgi:hypothetical protein